MASSPKKMMQLNFFDALALAVLWEKSWEDGTQVWQEEPDIAYDPSKVHKINHEGKCYKHTEAVFYASPIIESPKKYVNDVRARAVEEGRDASSIKAKDVSVTGGLARFYDSTNVDLSGCAVDEEFDFEEKYYENTIQGVIDNIKPIGTERGFTPMVVAGMFALGGSGLRPVWRSR
ncbi:hypothetical protein BDZ45DRAFT_709809 [Acephala macrosclerotiorum]|nr:hypothetical protein BDZ45DRAFT_709809 [Acephala macrosclerotiorum]